MWEQRVIVEIFHFPKQWWKMAQLANQIRANIWNMLFTCLSFHTNFISINRMLVEAGNSFVIGWWLRIGVDWEFSRMFFFHHLFDSKTKLKLSVDFTPIPDQMDWTKTVNTATHSSMTSFLLILNYFIFFVLKED